MVYYEGMKLIRFRWIRDQKNQGYKDIIHIF